MSKNQDDPNSPSSLKPSTASGVERQSDHAQSEATQNAQSERQSILESLAKVSGIKVSDKWSSLIVPLWGKIALLLAIMIFASIGYFTGRQLPQTEITGQTQVEVDSEEVRAQRKSVDDFVVTDGDGQTAKLSEYRGKVVVVTFWAAWCTPCLVELPTFAEIEKKLRVRGLKVMAINLDDNAEDQAMARDFWKREKFEFPRYADPQKQVAQKFEVERLPSNFVIDRAGLLAFSSFGAIDWSSVQVIEMLEGLLAEPLEVKP